MRCASPPESDSAERTEREVVEADVDEEAQPLAHFLEDRPAISGSRPFARSSPFTGTESKNESDSVIGMSTSAADVAAVDRDGERLGLEALAACTPSRARRA
jgi:hypothetical protein